MRERTYEAKSRNKTNLESAAQQALNMSSPSSGAFSKIAHNYLTEQALREIYRLERQQIAASKYMGPQARADPLTYL